MRLPHLFRQIHGDTIFSIWMQNDQAPFVRVIPQESLGRVEWKPPGGKAPDSSGTTVTVRCWNDRGVMDYEAASQADLAVAQEWARKHRETPPEEFKWLPEFSR